MIIFMIAGVFIRIWIKRKQHRTTLAEMERGAASAAVSPSRNMEQLPRLVTGMHCSQMMPHSQQGWDALASSETLNEPGAVANPSPKRLRSSVSLPKKFRNRGIQFGRNKYLSAIVELESPVSEKTSPNLPQLETMDQLIASSDLSAFDQAYADNTNTNQLTTAEPSGRSTSPKADIVPSLARRSPGTFGATLAGVENMPNIVARSASAGVLADFDPDDALFSRIERDPHGFNESVSHSRSLSLGAPASLPPSGPVPPIPIKSPHRLLAEFERVGNARQEAFMSRMSSSSIDSASSSVLATSPVLTRDDNDNEALRSPTLEDVVAKDEHALLKTVPNCQWQTPRISGPRPNTSISTSKIQKSSSVRGSIIRFSSDSRLRRKLSSASTDSEGSSRRQRLSIAQIGTANSIMMSRVSSSNSLTGSFGGVQKVSTPPRKVKRQTSVSASGSPAERQRGSALRDISGNANNKFTSNRESSDSTLNSGRSSCGNPFQWDPTAATLAVPSALKGSPNAKKGHRRKNCVRISTLTPQVLGSSARSRSASPAGLMGRIKEEQENEEFDRIESDQENVSQLTVQKRRPISVNSSTLPGNLRVQTLRASLTPDSPTLAAWTSYQKGGLATTTSGSNLSISPEGSRAGSRLSNRSSGAFVIPKFPTPSKARPSLAAVNHDAPLPEFSMEFPEDSNVSPLARRRSTSSASSEPSPVSPMEATMPSSPPLQMSRQNEYDPAWPSINLPMTEGSGHEYDPASPPSIMWDATDPERSSWFLPFAAGNMIDGGEEARSTATCAVKNESPPCSPKSSPREAVQQGEAETLTSSNASKMMSWLPSTSSSGALGLNSIPILLPPRTSEDPAYQLPEWKSPAIPTHTSAPRPRRVTSTGSPNRIRRRSPEPFLPTIPQSSSPAQSPAFHLLRPMNKPGTGKDMPQGSGAGPRGPRNAPAKSVLNNVSALRRMNSEYENGTPNRQSRNWQRLGREASPRLPWTGGLLPNEESSNSLFDFDFGTRTEQQTHGGAAKQEDGEPGSAMEEMDAGTFDRMLDGALAGFDAEFKRWSAGKDEEGEVQREEQRGSSIWEDGEQFWKSKKDVSIMPSYKIHPAETTPGRGLETTCDPRMLVTSSPVAMANTPGSLYDADGFLKI